MWTLAQGLISIVFIYIYKQQCMLYGTDDILWEVRETPAFYDNVTGAWHYTTNECVSLGIMSLSTISLGCLDYGVQLWHCRNLQLCQKTWLTRGEGYGTRAIMYLMTQALGMWDPAEFWTEIHLEVICSQLELEESDRGRVKKGKELFQFGLQWFCLGFWSRNNALAVYFWKPTCFHCVLLPYL